MGTPEQTPHLSYPWTDSIGCVWCIHDGPGVTPPPGTKVDPATIWWPEGVPKPWEKPEGGPEKPSGEKGACVLCGCAMTCCDFAR